MKQKPGFELHEVCGEKVIIAQGIENLDFSKLIHLNETAAFLWEKAKGIDFDEKTLASCLIEGDYDIDYDTALKDVQILLNEWEKLGLIE